MTNTNMGGHGGKAEQYFAAEPTSEDVRRRLHIMLRDHTADVEVSNGVFSGNRLDLGTSVLLKRVPELRRRAHSLIWAAAGGQSH